MKKTDRKGQLSLFIILGIVILALFAFAFYFMGTREQIGDEVSKAFDKPHKETPVDDYISNCLQDVTDDSISAIMANGGQSRLKAFRDEPTAEFPRGKATPLYVKFGRLDAPLYYIYDVEKGPVDLSYTLDQKRVQLEDRIKLSMPYCLDSYDPFTKQGANITFKETMGRIKVNFLAENNIAVIYHPDIIVEMDGVRFEPDVQTYQPRSNLQFFYNVIRIIMSLYSEDGMNHNGFPDLYLSMLANGYDFQFTKSTLSDSRVILTLVKNSTLPKYESMGVPTFFNVAFKYDWENSEKLRPYNDQLDSLPLIDETEWKLDSNDYEFRNYDNGKFTWDVSGYSVFEGYDYFESYSQYLSSSPYGVLQAQQVYPKMGPHDFIVKAFNLQNMETDYAIAKFRINFVDDAHDMPSVLTVNQTGTYRGFDYYYRIWAMGTRDRIPYYEIELSEELQNMPCEGYLYMDPITGELSGKVTADPGYYPTLVTVFQFLDEENITYVSFPMTIEVKGGYQIEGCDG